MNSILVVFNGEIYNYRALRAELRRRGHHFRTESDTEVIVHAYEEFGDDCVQHLRGMFALALWDRPRRRLFAARDRFGKKPLNYYWDGHQLLFGSEIKSLVLAGIPREVDPIALDEYLTYGYVPAPNTLFQGVRKLPAAHVLILEDGRLRTERYWDLPFAATCDDDEATAVERTRALLTDAVAVRLMSDVPLGAFLSGGVDSSIVVGLMAEQMTQPVKTFSIGFENDDASELPYARAVARAFGTEHHEFVVRPELVSVLPELVWAYDEPFADQSMLPTYYVSKLAREHVTVVLSGDGGDEIFGGYTHYTRELQVERIPPAARRVLGGIATVMPDGMRGKNRLRSVDGPLGRRYVRSNMSFPVAARARMYHPDYLTRLGAHDPIARGASLFAEAPHLDTMAAMQRADARLYLTDDILVKVDKASMFNSLETRAPLLDQELVEYVSSLSSAVRTPNGSLKHLLKKAAADRLPLEVLRRPKQGFSMPVERWFRESWGAFAREVLDAPRAHDRAILRPAFVRSLLRDQATTGYARFGRAIWALLCLELWFQTYIDSSLTEIEDHPSGALWNPVKPLTR